MNNIGLEILIVLLLTLLNGFFSMSEMALISVRKTRIASLAKKGNRRAKIIQELHATPENLFATIQIGISVITIVASAFAGASIAEELGTYLAQAKASFIAQNSYAIAFVAVVAIVTYFNIVLGELVPKSLGLRYAENFSLLAAYPVYWLSKISFWLIKLLNVSSNLILSVFRDSTNFMESRISEEEIRTLISEGKQAGTIAAREHEILENVFEFSDTSVNKIMTPRANIVAFDVNESPQETIPKVIEQGFTRVPFYDGELDKVVGILHVKDLLAHFAKNVEDLNIKKLLLPAQYVPGSQKINDALAQFQRKKMHLAMVTDEHGSVEGLVTLEDVLEELVGEISDEDDETPKNFIGDKEGNIFVHGQTPIVDFNKELGSHIPEDEQFNTVSGFILEKLGRFARPGDKVNFENLILTVRDAADRTVKSISVKKK